MTGSVFYTCVATKKSQWTRPSEADALALPPAPPSARRLYESAAAPGATSWNELGADQRASFEDAARAGRAAYKARIGELAAGAAR